MSDETPKGGDASTQNSDPTQNIKAEFGRKIGNLESEVSKLAQTNQQLLAHIQQMAVTNKPARTRQGRHRRSLVQGSAKSCRRYQERSEARNQRRDESILSSSSQADTDSFPARTRVSGIE
jgi:hypothetical protein